MKTTRLNRVCSTPLLPKFDLLKLLVLYCGIFGPLAGQVKFTKIYTFPTGTGSPTTGLVQGSDGGLYGASGPLGGPTTGIFKIGPNGIFSNLFSFPPGDNFGGQIYQSLFQANDGNFYGTTVGGGAGPTQYGTIFRCTPSGAVTVLHTFNGSDGAAPTSGVIQASDGNFYGSTSYLTPAGFGTIFRFGLSGLRTLYGFFSGGLLGTGGQRLIQGSDGNLYGTTTGGSIFRMTLSGGISTLYNIVSPTPLISELPPSALIEAANGYFYGTIPNGGFALATSRGAVFWISLQGTFGFAYSFDPAYGSIGQRPRGLMQASDGNFYGHMDLANDFPAVFQLTPTGNLSLVYTFQDGEVPMGSLLQAGDGNLYGAAQLPGPSAGHVFRFTLGLPLPKAQIYNVNPQAGIPGQLVGIVGQNLVGTSAVQFNATQAAFRVMSPNVIYAVVPGGASSGKIMLTNPAGTAISRTDFTVLP